MKPMLGTAMSRQVAFVGPFAVGKTTAVNSISDSPVMHTEVQSTAARTRTGKHIKETTTVGLDYGEWRSAPDGRPIAVVGTPGQARFDTVRRSVMPRSNAIVLWLFGQHPEAELDCELWLEFLGAEVSYSKITVAITRLDQIPGRTLEPFRAVADRFSPAMPVVGADPRVRDDVGRVIATALAHRASAPDALAAVVKEQVS